MSGFLKTKTYMLFLKRQAKFERFVEWLFDTVGLSKRHRSCRAKCGRSVTWFLDKFMISDWLSSETWTIQYFGWAIFYRCADSQPNCHTGTKSIKWVKMSQFWEKRTFYNIGTKCHTKFRTNMQGWNNVDFGINYYSDSKCDTMINGQFFSWSECPFYGCKYNPSTLSRNVTVVNYHSKRFFGWLLWWADMSRGRFVSRWIVSVSIF